MNDQPKPHQIPAWERDVALGPTGTSESLARRLLEAGASDKAVDAAGGPGTAERLRAELAAPHAA
jgi:hypothetical protein